MAAKKRGRKATKSARKSSRSVSKREAPKKTVIASDKKFNLLVSNLVMFGIIFLISVGLYYVTSNEIYANLFWMIGMITGFIALALFIVYLIFVVMRYLGK